MNKYIQGLQSSSSVQRGGELYAQFQYQQFCFMADLQVSGEIKKRGRAYRCL